MSVSGFSVQHDAEYHSFKRLERAVLAAEARCKEEQRQRRIKMGLPADEESRNIIQRVMRKKKGSKNSSQPEVRVEKLSAGETGETKAPEMTIDEFLKSRS